MYDIIGNYTCCLSQCPRDMPVMRCTNSMMLSVKSTVIGFGTRLPMVFWYRRFVGHFNTTQVFLCIVEYAGVNNCNVYVGHNSTDVDKQPTCVTSANISSIPPGGNVTFDCSPLLIGRYVTIRKTAPNEMLTVCEVTVSGYPLKSKFFS